MLLIQALATLWFWESNIQDQLYAPTAQTGPTATWMGSTVLFLGLTAYFQAGAVYRQGHMGSSWKRAEATALLTIMIISACGGLTSLLIYLIRRPGWTTEDSLCLAAIAAAQGAVSATAYYRLRHAARRKRLGRFANALISCAEGRMHLAIALRSVPRLCYGLGFFTAAAMSMSGHTIVSGLAIAALRLASAQRSRRIHPCKETKYLVMTELIGNLGSQAVLTACWLIAHTR